MGLIGLEVPYLEFVVHIVSCGFCGMVGRVTTRRVGRMGVGDLQVLLWCGRWGLVVRLWTSRARIPASLLWLCCFPFLKHFYVYGCFAYLFVSMCV